MATNSYHHGTRVLEQSDGLPVSGGVATAVIGMVCTAPDADDTTFPLNVPVLIDQPATAVAAAGNTGTLATALTMIANQIGTVPTVVVRIEPGETDAETTSAVIGGVDANGRKTGMQALLSADQRGLPRPRILGAPHLDSEPVAQALLIVARSLGGFCYLAAQGATMAEAIAYVSEFGDREALFFWPDFTAWDTEANAETVVPATAVAMGLRAQIDNTDGVQKTISNVLVSGVTGISKDVYFDLVTTGTEADLLNAANITTLINRGGFRLWGQRTPAQTTDFIFENYTRTAQVLAADMAEVTSSFGDKPGHASILKDIVEAANARLASRKAEGLIIDGKARIDPAKNQTQDVKQGKFAITYDYSPVPPIEQLTLIQTFTDTYFGQLAAQAAAA